MSPNKPLQEWPSSLVVAALCFARVHGVMLSRRHSR